MIVLSLFKGEIEVAPRRLTMREIAEDVAARHGLTLEELRGPSRRRYVSHPRQEAYVLIYAQGRFSLPQIGMWFGGRDHTTVLDGIRKHKTRMAAELAAAA